MNIGIIGAGPVGMILVAKLQEAGCNVALCERNEVKRNKIMDEGLVLHGTLNSTTRFAKIYASIAELAELDLDYLVFSIKTYSVADALAEAAHLNSPKLMVVAAQNGIDVEEALVPAFGESKILRMVVNYAGNLTAPNTVKVTFFIPPNYIGSINDSHPEKAKELAAVLNQVELHTEAVDSFDLLRRVWHKTILNSSLSALCGVGRLTMAEAVNDSDTAELVEQTIRECVEVAEKEKIVFPDDFVRQCLRYLKKGGDHFPSLAVDLINGRRTEIDHFNAKVVEYGRKHYVRTSLNLSFTNMVKAMSNRNIVYRVPGSTGDVVKRIMDKALADPKAVPGQYKKKNCFLGIDLGSSYSKFCVIDDQGTALFRYFLPTMSNDKQAFKNVMQAINSNFNVQKSCATGYGRKHFIDSDIARTEINCAAAGVSFSLKGEKNIIDIGGEDIKVIRCDKDDTVQNFYMNDKCASGTGAFLSEIAERAGINIGEMSAMAALSTYSKELNSFCTVFAKTEIMNWIFEGMSREDISRGIYISICNRMGKVRLDPGVPTVLIGGVIAHHPYLKELLSEKLKRDMVIAAHPQFTVSYGAAILAMAEYNKPLPEIAVPEAQKN